MPVCSTGISGVRAGMPASLVVDQAYVQSVLPPALAWLYPYLPWMHGLQIEDVGAFCSVDPPTWTVPTALDIYALITGNGISQAIAVSQFMQDITRAYFWYNLCECKSVATPAPPTAPTAPTGLPAVNPPGIVGIVPGPCGSQSWTALIDYVHGHPIKEITTDTYYGYAGGPSASVTLTSPISVAHPLQAQVTLSIATAGTEQTSSMDNNINVAWYTDTTGIGFSSAFTTLSGQTNHLGVTYQTGLLDVPDGTTRIFIGMGVGVGAIKTVTATVNWFCGSTNVGGPPDCCTATDPVSQATLNRILQLVTLLQRNVAPFAYVPGASHATLTGAGTLTIPSCIGILLTMTTIPGYVGEQVGTPTEYFEAGWFSWGTAAGYTAREWISHSPQLSFPSEAAQYTRLAYSLNPGVVATIQELYAET